MDSIANAERDGISCAGTTAHAVCRRGVQRRAGPVVGAISIAWSDAGYAAAVGPDVAQLSVTHARSHCWWRCRHRAAVASVGHFGG